MCSFLFSLQKVVFYNHTNIYIRFVDQSTKCQSIFNEWFLYKEEKKERKEDQVREKNIKTGNFKRGRSFFLLRPVLVVHGWLGPLKKLFLSIIDSLHQVRVMKWPDNGSFNFINHFWTFVLLFTLIFKMKLLKLYKNLQTRNKLTNFGS